MEIKQMTENLPPVIVVALMKSGTHLIQELMIRLGYSIVGQPRIPKSSRFNLTFDTALDLLTKCQRLNIHDDLSHQDEEEVLRLGYEVWKELECSTQLKLGVPLYPTFIG